MYIRGCSETPCQLLILNLTVHWDHSARVNLTQHYSITEVPYDGEGDDNAQKAH